MEVACNFKVVLLPVCREGQQGLQHFYLWSLCYTWGWTYDDSLPCCSIASFCKERETVKNIAGIFLYICVFIFLCGSGLKCHCRVN